MNRNVLYLALLAAVGCTSSTAKTVPIQTATIQRRDIIVTAEATGVIEPINVVEVKSKTASGQVMAMPVDIGYFVKPGDLIVQIDTTILHQQAVQAAADYALAPRRTSRSPRRSSKRQTELYKNAHHHAARCSRRRRPRSPARRHPTCATRRTWTSPSRRSIDARVRRRPSGTILTKPVSIGQVIQAGGTSVSGGTMIAHDGRPDEGPRPRARGRDGHRHGEARPDRRTSPSTPFPTIRFVGKVDHIEPQATVQQNVTMFATLIALDNSEGLLQPGMNGEVSIIADTRLDAIAVPNDAIRSPREATQAAPLLGLNPDSVRAQLRGNGGGGRAAAVARWRPGWRAGRPRRRRRGGDRCRSSNGELALPLQGGGQGGQGGGGMRGGRGPQVQVTDADCKKVDDAMKKKPDDREEDRRTCARRCATRTPTGRS